MRHAACLAGAAAVPYWWLHCRAQRHRRSTRAASFGGLLAQIDAGDRNPACRKPKRGRHVRRFSGLRYRRERPVHPGHQQRNFDHAPDDQSQSVRGRSKRDRGTCGGTPRGTVSSASTVSTSVRRPRSTRPGERCTQRAHCRAGCTPCRPPMPVTAASTPAPARTATNESVGSRRGQTEGRRVRPPPLGHAPEAPGPCRFRNGTL